MSGKYLLDTNIVIALFAQDTPVMTRLKGAEEVFIPSIVIGELYYGALKSGQVSENVARIDEFVVANVILNCDAETGRWYGEIKKSLHRKGQPIPENDIWIAALTRQYDLMLTTRDAHFKAVENLKFETW